MKFLNNDVASLEALIEWLTQEAKVILITAHKDPDIDAIGSCLAFQKQLAYRNIPSTIWLEDVLEPYAQFLPDAENILTQIPQKNYDTLIVLDSPNLNRIRQENIQNNAAFRAIPMIINIDHHPDNTKFGHINIVCPEVSSVGELLFHLYEQAGWTDYSTETATCLYAAISFDTGRFLFSNVTADTFFAASELMKKGAKAYYISQTMYENKSEVAFNIMKIALDRLVIDPQNRFAYSSLPAASPESEIKIIDFIRQLGGIDIFLVFCENKNGEIKINIRSKGHFNASAFAAQFGGGGHVLAAGITLNGDLETICKAVITQLELSL